MSLSLIFFQLFAFFSCIFLSMFICFLMFVLCRFTSSLLSSHSLIPAHPPSPPSLQDRRAALTCVCLARPCPRFPLKRPNYSAELWCSALRLSPAPHSRSVYRGQIKGTFTWAPLSLLVLHQPMGGRQLVCRYARTGCDLPTPPPPPPSLPVRPPVM